MEPERGRGTVQRHRNTFHDESQPFGGRGDALKSHLRHAGSHRSNGARKPDRGSRPNAILIAGAVCRTGRRVSIIDIGSNSIRLVIYEGIARSPTVLFNERCWRDCGRGIVTTGKLDPA